MFSDFSFWPTIGLVLAGLVISKLLGMW